MTTSTASPRIDAMLLRYLKSLPGYDRWNAAPLPPQVDHYLRTADRQQLMTALAIALERLLDEN